MAGLYPDNEQLSIYGEQVEWPGMDKDTGKFTNGDFDDPLKKPSFIPADTFNLILDNLSELIKLMKGTPNNQAIDQLAKLFTSAATPNKGVVRDSAGRTKFAAPSASDDAAIKKTVDDHAALTAPHSATSAATASRIVMRDSAGRAKVVAPSAADDIARKDTVDTVDTKLTTHGNLTTAHSATSAATASRIVIRDSAGRAKFAAPSAADDAARKGDLSAVGEIYLSVSPDSPAARLGGTWTRWGQGRVPVGLSEEDADFNTVEKTGGTKTHVLSIAEMPTHTHKQNSHTHVQNPHSHSIKLGNRGGNLPYPLIDSTANPNTAIAGTGVVEETAINQATTVTNQNTGGGGSHNNLQPYITCYMWKRTA